MSVSPDLMEITRAISILTQPDQVVELRALNTARGTCSGHFDDLNTLGRAAFDLSSDESVPNVYITLQNISSDLIGRPSNVVSGHQHRTTNDTQIRSYRWLFLDFDPDRPSKVSSTEAEKASAHELAVVVREYLARQQIKTVFADSGNGFHLLAKINLLATHDSRTLVKSLLDALSAKFSTRQVKIDRTTFNPSRISKLYGTVARKGLNTPERPWRLSQIVEAPDLSTVSEQDLKMLLTALRSCPTQRISAATKTIRNDHTLVTPEMVEAEAGRLDLRIGRRSTGAPDPNGNSWMRWHLVCPFNSEHTKTDAYIFLCVEGPQKSAYGYHCSHNSCAGHELQQFREKTGGFRFGHVPEPPGKEDSATVKRILFRTASDIKTRKISWLWNNRVPLGKLTLFVGVPGSGKSLVAGDVAARLSTAADWYDAPNNLQPCETLMFVGEDDLDDTTVPRLQAAGADLTKIHFAQSVIVGEGKGSTREERGIQLDKDLAQIEDLLRSNLYIRLLVIDPVSNYLGSAKMNDEQEIRRVLLPLKCLSERLNVTTVGVMHLNKKSDSGAINRVGGAMAFVGVSRAVFLFQKSEEVGNFSKRHYMVGMKNNLSKTLDGLVYEISSRPVTVEDSEEWLPYAHFVGKTDKTADGVLGSESGRPPVKREHATQWLQDFLMAGPISQQEIVKSGAAAGFSFHILRAAKLELRVESVKIGKVWMWQLPQTDLNSGASFWKTSEGEDPAWASV